jgi:poly-beta-1,6-N-acetyl-D-glucosamine synthase
LIDWDWIPLLSKKYLLKPFNRFRALSKSVFIKNNSTRYVVISPVKDEAQLIEKTISSMIQQSVKPIVWVIVNDGSSDGTESIILEYAKTYNWIKLINRKSIDSRQRGEGVIKAFYAGYETLSEKYDFIVKLDGDVSFEPTYFESLLEKFRSDPHLGIAGGGLYEKPDGKSWILLTTKDHVRGCTKIYRRTCFEAIGGLVPSMGWDGIDEWKALSLGWKINSFVEIKIYHYRYTGAGTGYLKSFYEQGTGAYRMGYHPVYLVARALNHLDEQPYILGGLAMMWAYYISWLRREEMLADQSVVRFIRKNQMIKLKGILRGEPIHE